MDEMTAIATSLVPFAHKTLGFKVRVADFVNIPITFANYHVDTLTQCDIFFISPDENAGRLKLRHEYSVGTGKVSKPTFIRYSRKGFESEMLSRYYIEDMTAFKNTFNGFLKEEVTVDKERSLYLYENARIHLDTIQSLPHDKCHFIGVSIVIEHEEQQLDAKKLLKKLLVLMGLRSSSSSSSTSTWTQGVEVMEKKNYWELVLEDTFCSQSK
jgi:adenylate cyclase class IV